MLGSARWLTGGMFGAGQGLSELRAGGLQTLQQIRRNFNQTDVFRRTRITNFPPVTCELQTAFAITFSIFNERFDAPALLMACKPQINVCLQKHRLSKDLTSSK